MARIIHMNSDLFVNLNVCAVSNQIGPVKLSVSGGARPCDRGLFPKRQQLLTVRGIGDELPWFGPNPVGKRRNSAIQFCNILPLISLRTAQRMWLAGEMRGWSA